MATKPDDPSLDPSTTSAAYSLMVPRWFPVDVVLGGTQSMRRAGKDVLPQHAEEDDDTWIERNSVATLYNLVERTLETWIGKPLGDPIVQNDDVPEQVSEWLKNIDLLGNNLDVFAHQWFGDGLSKSFADVLVEMPRIREGTEEAPRTRQDDIDEGVRPYWVRVRPENVIFAEADVIDGREVLRHVRITEMHTARVGFAEVHKQRIRVYDKGGQAGFDGEGRAITTMTHVTLWELKEKKKQEDEDEWLIVEEWDLGIDFIPMVTFYADREEFRIGKPPLLDAAELNIRHFQGTADQIMAITVARFPMLAASGAVDDDGILKVGPRQWLHMPDATGKFYYVETEGNALEAGRKDLEDTEQQIASYGAEFLRRRKKVITKGERSMDESEAVAPLEIAAIKFEDALNQALAMTAIWANLEGGAGTVEVSKDFGADDLTDVAMAFIKDARQNRDLSRKNYLRRGQTLGALEEDFDFEENENDLAEEDAAIAAKITIDEGEDPNDPKPPEGGEE